MPVVAPALIGVAGSIGMVAAFTSSWGAIGAFGVGVATVLLQSQAARMVAEGRTRGVDDPSLAEAGRGHLVNRRSSQAVIPVVYGTHRVGLQIVYVGTSDTDNKYLHIVGKVSVGPVKGIRQVDGVDQIWLDDKLYTEFGALVYYEFFNGTSTQTVCSTLHDAIPEWNEPLRHFAYLYMRLEYDQDKFHHAPEITLELEGRTVYDPRTEGTAYSNNGALCVRDHMTHKIYGLPIPGDRINDDSVGDVANWCDVKGFTLNMVLYENAPVIDRIESMLANFRGGIIYSGNKFVMKYKDLNYESPAMNLTESDIIERGGDTTLQINQPVLFDTPNTVRIKYINAEKKYHADDYIKPDSVAVATEGSRREKVIDLLGTVEPENVQKQANYWLERLRINKDVACEAGQKYMQLEPWDLVQLTHSIPGWENKLLRVESPQLLLPSYTVSLSFVEEDSIFYDDVYNPQDHEWYDTILPDPSAAVMSVRNVSHREEVYYFRDRSFTRWKIDFDPPLASVYPWWDYAEIWLRIVGKDYVYCGQPGVYCGGGKWCGQPRWKYMTKSEGDYMIDPVEEKVTYYVKIRSVSIHGAKEDFDSATTVSKTILGKTAAPSNLTGLTAVASGDTVSLFANPIADPDIKGYEIRLGDSWVGGLFIAFELSPTVRLSGVRPGTHTFWMSPKDNAGQYSDSPVSATCTVYYPAGYTEKNAWAWDFTTGTHDNTEHDTYEEEDILKCSHGGNLLTGTWKSPDYDMGSPKTVRVWGDFLTTFISSSGLFSAVFPDGVTFADRDTRNKTFAQLWQASQAGVIQAVLKWSDSSPVDDNLKGQADFFQILAPEINGRYVKVDITITDPVEDAYLYLYELNMKAYYWQ